MVQKSERFYPSRPLLEKNDLEQRLEKKLNDVIVLITISVTPKRWLHTWKPKTTNQERNTKRKNINYNFIINWYICYYYQNIEFFYVKSYRYWINSYTIINGNSMRNINWW